MMKGGTKQIAVVGTGPAALMCASRLVEAGHAVTLFEKRKSAGRKLLVAGSSGLNISNSLPLPEFARHYAGAPYEHWLKLLEAFPPRAWLDFIHGLGFGTFEGTSGRYFVEEMKAARLLQAWIKSLTDRGARLEFGRECTGLEAPAPGPAGQGAVVRLHFGAEPREFDAVCFALGGGSWEPDEVPLRWPAIFKNHGIAFDEFEPSNSGYSVAWSSEFLKEAEGQPIKTMALTTARGTRRGEIVVTSYGLEGTPVYAVGARGPATLDLKPDLSLEQMIAKCQAVRENLSPIRRIKKQLNLGPAALALIFHHSPPGAREDLRALCRAIKAFPLTFGEPRPLAESISSSGGVRMSEVTETGELKRFPGVYCAGEMLAWDAPTGGFLLQACVAQGHVVGRAIAGAADQICINPGPFLTR